MKYTILSPIVWFGILPSAMAMDFPGPDPGPATSTAKESELRLENGLLSASWRVADGKLRPDRFVDKQPGGLAFTADEVFTITFADGRVVKASELTIVGRPLTITLPAVRRAYQISARHDAKQLQVRLADKKGQLAVRWTAVLGDGANYARQFVTIRALKQLPAIESITLLEPIGLPDDAHVEGTVAGSPVVTGNLFLACEHPNARNEVVEAETPDGPDQPPKSIRCSLDRSHPLPVGKPLVCSSVVGVTPPGQMRRAFLYYIERERPRPYMPFLHYNSWYDIAWPDRKMNEKQCLDVIEAFGRDLTEKRGVALDSFVFDDGWDDNKTLWGFHEGFPNGFAPLEPAAKKYKSHVGVWLSPWGGYGRAKAERMQYGKTQGFETNRNGFSLAGPKYYARFRDVCAGMIRKYDVNYFKFDGVGIGNNKDGAPAEFMPDIEGLLRLCGDLRQIRPDVYLSLTTGTWPSPFWLLHGDSIWRNGADCGFHGAGSMRQQWITYRDVMTYRMIVRRGPLYPINSLMNQGICYAQLGTATRMKNDLKDVVDEIRMMFACGTQLQELYVTPGMMTPPMWDALAEAAAWSKKNADVLVDVHFIGGDPGEGQPYGYASWSPQKGILALRNPGEKPARIAIDVQTAFELPEGAASRYVLRSPWKDADQDVKLTLEAGKPHTFDLAPFEALVLEAAPGE